MLAVDLGARRIGVAISDEMRMTARPLGTVSSVGPKRDAKAIRELIEGMPVDELVVGLPLSSTGEVTEASRRAREQGSDLARRLELPVRFVDESHTTVEAAQALSERGLSRRRRAERIDGEAAVLILQAFLAEGAHVEDAP